jgi:hypothetical protein
LSADLSWAVPADTIEYQVFTTGAPVVRHGALALLPDDTVVHADQHIAAHFARYVGVALDNAGAGESVHVKLNGLVENTTWTWDPGKPVFVSVDGTLTQDVPHSGYRQLVGIASRPDAIYLRFAEAIVCAEDADDYARSYGTMGGSGGGGDPVALLWATPQDLRDGILTDRVVSPAVLKIVRDEMIAAYGVIPARLATVYDISARTPGKLVTADVLPSMGTGPGTGGAMYEHKQTAAVKIWEVQHNLGNKYPHVLALDEDDQQIEGAIDWKNATDIFFRLHFYVASAGRALVSV